MKFFMTKQSKKDITTLLDYLWIEEKRHYLCGSSKDHIFIVLKRIAKSVGYKPNESKI